MTILEKPAKQAQRRLWLNRWLAVLGWTFVVAAGLFALMVIVERIWIAAEDATRFYGILAASLAGAAVVVAAIFSAVTRDSMLVAAAQLDQAAGLKERISSGLHCQAVGDPFARAVVADAERVGRSISVRSHLPMKFPDSAGYAGATFVIALLVFWLFPTMDLSGKQEQRQEERKRSDKVARTIADVKPVLDNRIKKLRQDNPLLKEQLKDLDPLKPGELQTPYDVQRKLKKQLTKVSNGLEKKKNEERMAKIEQFKKMLRNLSSRKNAPTPVGNLSKALAKGDFKSALKALDNIKSQLSKAPKTAEEKQKAEALQKQLKELSEKVAKLAADQKKLENQLSKAGLSEKDIKKILKNLEKKDLTACKKELADKGLSKKQMDKMMKQMKSCSGASSAASKLAQSLAQAGAGSMGQLSQSQLDGLKAVGGQLSEMEALQQELNQLNAAMAEIKAMQDKIGKGCKNCNGTGCGKCMGTGCSNCGGLGCGMCAGTGKGPGMGQNPGQGQGGIAPEQQTPYKTQFQKANVFTKPGSIIHQEWIDGEQYKGEVSSEFMDANIAAEREIKDAISREAIPRIYRSAVKKFFTRTGQASPAEDTGDSQDSQ